MNVYAESSAILSWLLGEDGGDRVREVLRGSKVVATSELTLLECERVLIRATTLGAINEGTASDRRASLSDAAQHWHVLRISSEIVERARHSFPGAPIRTLDAIHLSSALTARSAVPRLELLSLDSRVRRAGRQLGFRLRPDRTSRD